MKKHLPIFFGILIPFVGFLYLIRPESRRLPSPKIIVQSLRVSFGDRNVENLSYSQFHEQKVTDSLKGVTGDYTVYIKNLLSDQEISLQENSTFYAASLYKIPIAIKVLEAVEKKELDLDTKLSYSPANYYSGSGKIQSVPYGTQFSIEELLFRLIRDSDNVAQSMLVGVIGRYSALSLMPDPTSLKVTHIVKILEDLYDGEYLNEANTAKLLGYMSKTSFDNRINAGLVKGISFSHKIGNWAATGSWHDCGIVFAYEPKIVCLMSKNTTFEDFLIVSERIGYIVSDL